MWFDLVAPPGQVGLAERDDEAELTAGDVGVDAGDGLPAPDAAAVAYRPLLSLGYIRHTPDSTPGLTGDVRNDRVYVLRGKADTTIDAGDPGPPAATSARRPCCSNPLVVLSPEVQGLGPPCLPDWLRPDHRLTCRWRR